MGDLSLACNQAIEQGVARRFPGGAIEFIGPIDLIKLAEVENSYTKAFERRRQESEALEREAALRWWREGPWYF